MNPHKFCFISCFSDIEKDLQIDNAIRQLHIPPGYELEYLGVSDVPSKARGYNEAIEATDAEYKIFFNENVTLSNPDILNAIIQIYMADPDIVVIGVLGTARMPVDMVLQHGITYGKPSDETFPVDGKYIEVLCISDDFLVVRGDFRFDDKTFDGDYFFAEALCANMLKSKKKIVVADQSLPWINKTLQPDYSPSFEKYRQIALEKFGDIFCIDKSAQRIGVVYLEEMSPNDLLWPLMQTRHDIEIVDIGISIYRNTEEDISKVYEYIRNHHIDVLFSFDFCPAVSDACEKSGVKYISWIYDAPQQALYEDLMTNKCNYIFSFDKDQTRFLLESQCPHAFYQPLATNITRIQQINISEDDIKNYSCDISFVGTLYSDNPYDEIIENLSQESRKELDTICKNAYGIWDGKDHILGKLTNYAKSEILKTITTSTNSMIEKAPDEYINARLISRHLANMERKTILERLSKYNLRFYTRDLECHLEKVKICPALSYSSELPIAYNLSKINLNITLHTITSGIPLRVFDIMGSGGFMLSNFQPELEELFEIGKEIEVYRNLEELEEKVSFYLTHENERARIAHRGLDKVIRFHNYETCVERILKCADIS